MDNCFVIHDRQAARRAVVGKKAWNLFLLQKHFAVPEFSVVSTRAYQDYKKHNKITSQLERELKEVLRQFIEKKPIAIRSSGTAEDLSGASFAGLYSTTLNITRVDDAIAAIDFLILSEQIDQERIFILGHSLGGMVGPRIVEQDDRIDGLIILAGNTRGLEDLILEQTFYLIAKQTLVGPAQDYHPEPSIGNLRPT